LAGGVILTAYSHYKMDRNLAPGRNAYRGKGLHRLSFQYDPEDYTELGQGYRRKAIWLELFIFGWCAAAPWIITAGD
jgi:hypothetical protein